MQEVYIVEFKTIVEQAPVVEEYKQQPKNVKASGLSHLK